MGEAKERAPVKDTKTSSPKAGAGDRGPIGKKESGQPKGSREYKPGDLKASGKENWKTERKKHTTGAERAAREAIKAKTGKDANLARRTPGDKVEHHHHAGVKESKQVGLNPKVAGEKERMTAVHSSKSKTVWGTYGDKVDPAKNKKSTHHNVAAKIDKAEQARAAKALGMKGDNPKLPKTDAGRKALVDASRTSKSRWPATADQAERAKPTWFRKEPVGPPVDANGRVIKPVEPSSARPAGPPKVENVPKEGGFWGKVAKAGKAGRALGVLGGIAGSSGDIVNKVVRDYPERLPEGEKFEIYRPQRGNEFMWEPTGYTVEKNNGEVIYRDPKGSECTRDEANHAMGKRPKEA